MAVDTTLLTDYTFAQIKLAAKHAIMTNAVGGNELRMSDGRVIARVSLKEATDLYVWADTMTALDGDENGGVVLGGFGEPQ